MPPSPSVTPELSRWRKQLADYRQPWPEWEQLERFVNQLDFSLEADEALPFRTHFLAGSPDRSGRKLIHSVITPQQEKQFLDAVAQIPAFPRYLVPLLDLKYADCLMMAGGIASYLCVYDMSSRFELPTPIGPETCRLQPHAIQYQPPETVRWPEKSTFPFQSNASGGVFFLDDNSDVTSFSVEQCGFALIGSADDFIRYCLVALLANQDWYGSYQRRWRLSDYRLAFVEDVGMD